MLALIKHLIRHKCCSHKVKDDENLKNIYLEGLKRIIICIFTSEFFLLDFSTSGLKPPRVNILEEGRHTKKTAFIKLMADHFQV